MRQKLDWFQSDNVSYIVPAKLGCTHSEPLDAHTFQHRADHTAKSYQPDLTKVMVTDS